MYMPSFENYVFSYKAFNVSVLSHVALFISHVAHLNRLDNHFLLILHSLFALCLSKYTKVYIKLKMNKRNIYLYKKFSSSMFLIFIEKTTFRF